MRCGCAGFLGGVIWIGVAAVAARAQEPRPRGAGERPVIVYLKTQFLKDAAAFGRFCQKNAGAKRGELRKRVVAELKKIAAAEQQKLLADLKLKDARRLWIVNGVAVKVTALNYDAVRKHPLVRWIYPGGRFPEEGEPGRVSAVLKPTRREPFTTKKKKIPWNLKHLKVPEVWKKLGITGEGIVVAMYDQGVNYKHEDLTRNIWINEGEIPNNGKDDDGNGVADDLYGFNFSQMRAEVIGLGRRQHGTLTSSVVAGDGTGGVVTGVAPRARIMPLVGWGGAYVAARTFQYALENDADIVNMSFSIPGLGHTRGLWRKMAEHATCAGLVLVSGSGNFQQQAEAPVQIRIPEGIPCVICVGGVNKKNKVTRFSSMGPVEWSGVKFYEDYPMPKGLVKPDVCALPGPGIALVSTQDTGYLPENNGRRGNSLSAPHVAGICALMLQANPDLVPWRIKAILEETAKDLSPRGKDNGTGAGLVNAYRAVQAVLPK